MAPDYDFAGKFVSKNIERGIKMGYVHEKKTQIENLVTLSSLILSWDAITGVAYMLWLHCRFIL